MVIVHTLQDQAIALISIIAEHVPTPVTIITPPRVVPDSTTVTTRISCHLDKDMLAYLLFQESDESFLASAEETSSEHIYNINVTFIPDILN